MVNKRLLIVPLVALGLAGCAGGGRGLSQVIGDGLEGVYESTFGILHTMVSTTDKTYKEGGLGQAILELPNAAANGLLTRPLSGLSHAFTGSESPPFDGNYHTSLAKSRIITGAGWMALGGYVLPLITPAQGALIGGAVGLGVDAYKEPQQ